jgi:hypothetical protein
VNRTKAMAPMKRRANKVSNMVTKINGKGIPVK